MITLHSGSPFLATIPGSGDLAFPAGTYVFPDVSRISVFTNQWVEVSPRPNSHLSLAASGEVVVTPAPDLFVAFSAGFVASLSSVGIALILRKRIAAWVSAAVSSSFNSDSQI